MLNQEIFRLETEIIYFRSKITKCKQSGEHYGKYLEALQENKEKIELFKSILSNKSSLY
jgi:hypothetical protein